MDQPSLGDQELDLLRYVADHSPATAREIADTYGDVHGLARTTVVTVLERLRQKGYLARHRRKGIFQYSIRVAASDVLQGVVKQFVEKTLGGSVSPVVAYLAHGPALSDEDLNELQQLVDDMKARREEETR